MTALTKELTRPLTLALLFSLFSALLVTLLAHSATALVTHDYYGPYGGDHLLSWEDDWRLNNKSHATPPFHPETTFGGCFIAGPENTLLADLDCDKVPDAIDNCRGIPNPSQADQNGNGIGDACDLLVDKIVLDPGRVLEGRAFTATAFLTNYRTYPIRNLALTIQIPELGLEQKEYVDVVAPGQQIRQLFYLRLPNCVTPKEYDVVLFVEFPTGPGMQESFYIPTRMRAESSSACTPQGTKEGKSIIDILDIQDIDKKRGGVYPFTIVNGEDEGQAYVLSVKGIDDWGSYEIRPRSLIVVPAGESRKGELIIYAKQGVTGEHGFVLNLRSKADAKQELLTARIKQDVPGRSTRTWYQFGLFIVLAILLIAAFGLTFYKIERAKKRARTPEDGKKSGRSKTSERPKK